MEMGQREWELLKKIGKTRISGSKEEKETAELLKQEIEQLGVKAELMPFEVSAWTIQKAALTSKERSFEVAGYGHCADTPEEGVTAGFYYMEQMDEVAKALAKDKIVLVNGYLGLDGYKAVVESGAVGFITYSGDIRDTLEDTDLFTTRELRPQLQKLGKLPGVHLRVQDAMELVKSEPSELTLTVQQNESTAVSYNVLSEIPGKENPEEVILLTAHLDSVEFSSGVYDNGAGSVILMELLRYFKEHQPKRTLRFLFCGSEERGLLGSHAYVQQHPEALSAIRLVVNVDVAGPVLGQERIFVMAEEETVAMVQLLAKEEGFAAKIESNIYSSDAIPFADQGIPGVNFTRFGVPGTAYIHNRHDTLQFMSAASLEKTTRFVLSFLKRVDGSKVFAIPRQIPKNIREKVDEYLKKPKKEEKKEN